MRLIACTGSGSLSVTRCPDAFKYLICWRSRRKDFEPLDTGVFVHSASSVSKSRTGHPALTLNYQRASLAGIPNPAASEKNILASRCCAGWLRPAFDRHLGNRTGCARSSRDRRRCARFHDAASSFGRSDRLGSGARSARMVRPATRFHIWA
jgi:hypothetical protein